MQFRLFGIDFTISFFFLAFAALSAAMSRDGAAAVSMLLIIWHELGHMVFIAAVGGQISAVTARLGGFEVICRKTLRPFKRALALAGGVIFNAVAGGAMWAAGAPIEYRASNLVLALFNLLPISALDGGQIFQLVISRSLDANRAEKICRAVSATAGAAVMALGIYLFAISKGISVAVFAVYLIFSVFQQLF